MEKADHAELSVLSSLLQPGSFFFFFLPLQLKTMILFLVWHFIFWFAFWRVEKCKYFLSRRLWRRKRVLEKRTSTNSSISRVMNKKFRWKRIYRFLIFEVVMTKSSSMFRFSESPGGCLTIISWCPHGMELALFPLVFNSITFIFY